jgi:hypothetical protein
MERFFEDSDEAVLPDPFQFQPAGRLRDAGRHGMLYLNIAE